MDSNKKRQQKKQHYRKRKAQLLTTVMCPDFSDVDAEAGICGAHSVTQYPNSEYSD